MAIGTDRVQLLKDESAALGGNAADAVPYPAPIEPQEDAIETCGVYIQDENNRDETTFIERVGTSLRFVDGDNPTGRSLSELFSGASVGGVFMRPDIPASAIVPPGQVMLNRCIRIGSGLEVRIQSGGELWLR